MNNRPLLQSVLLVTFTWMFAVTARAQTLGAGDISLRPGASAALTGQWVTLADGSAAGGTAVWYPNAGAAKVVSAAGNPQSYFEVTFDAQAGIPYRLWLRMKAQSNAWANDSVFVQFSGSVNSTSAPVFRIGTSSAAEVNLEDCVSCGLSGWGWQDNGYGAGVLGPAIYFEQSGAQVLRVQTREDGAIIDQILLSPSMYIASSPGALKNDTVILLSSGGSPGPSVTLVRGPYLQQIGAAEATVVWATRENGPTEVRYARAGEPAESAPASTRLVTAATNGLGFDYYQHEARLTGLSSASEYSYDPFVSGTDVTPASATLRTAPAVSTGSVTFVAFGDSGTGSTEQQEIANLIAAETFDIALHAGDIAYGSTTGTGDATYRTFEDWFFSKYQPWLSSHAIFPAEGNHDSRPSNQNGAAYLDLFSLPTNGASPLFPDHAERYYSFDYGPVHFIALDTEFTFLDPVRRAEQLAWLDADLAATAQPWKVAFFHRPGYSAGAGHGSDLAVRASFGPFFERYGVQLVVTAHEHDYERTRPIREGPDGSEVTYVVTGGGGAALYANGSATWTALSASRHHYVKVCVDTCTLTWAAIGLDRSVFDSLTLSRCGAPPPPPPPVGGMDVVLYASDAPLRAGGWTVVTDATAANGQALHHPNAGAAKVTAAAANPVDYFEMTFTAEAGVPYRLWIRGKAEMNFWGNDSVFVEFADAVNAQGAALYRIGAGTAAVVNLEDCISCGVSGWGWQDNGYDAGVLGPVIYFATTGPQRIRVQTREDGLAIDQIVLSPGRFLTESPGAQKNDTTIIQP